MRNPYLSLLGTAWRYARNEKKKYVLVYTMFLCANLTWSLNPLLFGWFMGHLQTDITHVWRYALLYAGLAMTIQQQLVDRKIIQSKT